MGIFFGTDGLRGRVNTELTSEVATKCGNALCSLKDRPKIVIGRDTRVSGCLISTAFALGAIDAGAEIIDVGICPTAGIAYLTQTLMADFGVVISASHNSSEYNGIKIFDKNGYKLSDKNEENVERNFIKTIYATHPNFGHLTYQPELVSQYIEHLKSCVFAPLDGLKVVIDCSNGASYSIAPEVYNRLGCDVKVIHNDSCGININDNCGSLYPSSLIKNVLDNKADIGFAFDGDSDRIVAVDSKGLIYNGDMILYILSTYLKENNKLNSNTVVGTSHTNMGIEKALINKGITLIRSDIGDKYVLEKILSHKLSLGGEQSGHIIIKEKASTGDGILTSLILSSIICKTKKSLSELFDVKLFPQANINIPVNDKIRIINSEKLTDSITREHEILGKDSRVLVRASGTEDKIRIMIENESLDVATQSAERIALIVKQISLGNE
ncbi:MAG: phosphoglucosamine mutase [Clostridia bacterium]